VPDGDPIARRAAVRLGVRRTFDWLAEVVVPCASVRAETAHRPRLEVANRWMVTLLKASDRATMGSPRRVGYADLFDSCVWCHNWSRLVRSCAITTLLVVVRPSESSDDEQEWHCDNE
jgi:hypothetical protein